MIGNIINPDVFLLAAEIMHLEKKGGGECGSCLALQTANFRLGIDTWSGYSTKPHHFFKYFFPWIDNRFDFKDEQPDVIDFGYYSEENRPHRVFALLLCHELCIENNKRLEKNEKRRNKKV